MILITGATGNNGKEIVRLLAEAGIPARALVRDKAKAADLNWPGIEKVEGDLTQPETLRPALRGIEKAFLLTPYAPDQVGMQTGFISAAKRAGVQHIVKFSGMSADANSSVGIFRQHGEIERNLEASGMAYTHLRPTSFMQNFLSSAATIARGALYAPMAQARANFVDVRDIAAVAFKALTEPGHEGKAYDITGPEALTPVEIAERLGKAIGRPVAYIAVTPEQYKSSLMQMGVPEWMADGLNELYAAYRDGAADCVTDTVSRVGGKTPMTFQQFAEDHARLFQAA
jgi:uncharacterized protein YbjT (DUF2867 family)